jgi:alpha-glucosidase (family GH31 glycosyl hydrolase)
MFDKNKLPLDVMWSDLDYMSSKAIFTVDAVNYPPRKMRELMISKDIHYIPLIDVGVSVQDATAITQGTAQGVFLKTRSGSPYIAKVWPGNVHFVDFLHPNSSRFWCSQLERLFELIPFSGVWLDMN